MRRPLILLLLAGLVACKRDTPEAALRVQLAQMQAAVGERRAGDFMQAVASGFSGNDCMDRAALHNLLRMQAHGNSALIVTTGPVQVQMHGQQATMKFKAHLAGGSGRLLPDSAQTYSITSGWRQEEGEWRAYYAQWEAVH
ncbi:nuclear transport factor 2 family protein [Pseudoxanthomonas gei]|uniref:Nuclear transport factor 2 family protein n=1 Tax=Pseudoxanthomonas gei TaxID=1383030 RepID=A0ABX0A759_9GAMM|nr:nuclear transport factor 2 family protein [Pseudoxanthomonas gei]